MRRRYDQHGEEGEAGAERWLVSYADFITLMFAFFAVLYATSEKDLSKSREFQESIKRFLIKAGGSGGSGGDPQINQAEKHTTPIEPPIPTFQRAKPESEQVLTQVEQMIEAGFTTDERRRYIQDVTSDEWGVRVILNAEALYPPGSDKFKEGALTVVNKFADLLTRSKSKLLIEGHVTKEEKGPFRSTWDFAAARAVNFLRYLQAKRSLRPEQLAATSYGDSRPLFENPKQIAMNSRLEIVLLNPELE